MIGESIMIQYVGDKLAPTRRSPADDRFDGDRTQPGFHIVP
jgi:hypothetical protein